MVVSLVINFAVLQIGIALLHQVVEAENSIDDARQSLAPAASLSGASGSSVNEY